MPDKNEHTGRFGGPGSSHQDKEHPGKNQQEHGHKKGGGTPGSVPDPMKDAEGDESGGGHPTVMNLEHPELLAVCGVPNPGRAIQRACEHTLSVR